MVGFRNGLQSISSCLKLTLTWDVEANVSFQSNHKAMVWRLRKLRGQNGIEKLSDFRRLFSNLLVTLAEVKPSEKFETVIEENTALRLEN